MAEKEYSNGEITIVWRPDLCIHATNCWRGLPQVFRPKDKPWINVEEASSDIIIDQVSKCPSGALSFFRNSDVQIASEPITYDQINLAKDGPYILQGNYKIIDEAGNETLKSGKLALCRCGVSANKPFCDGSHKNSGFKSAED